MVVGAVRRGVAATISPSLLAAKGTRLGRSRALSSCVGRGLKLSILPPLL